MVKNPRKPKTAKLECARVFSLIVRRHGSCEHCGKPDGEVQLQCAHWISRTYGNTFTDFDNAFCLCAGCHHYFGKHPTEFSRWAIGQRGEATYQRLFEASREPSKVDWFDELERLREIAEREDVEV